MGILGNVGSLYMWILIVLLVLGFGLLGLWLIDYMVEVVGKNKESKVKVKKAIESK